MKRTSTIVALIASIVLSVGCSATKNIDKAPSVEAQRIHSAIMDEAFYVVMTSTIPKTDKPKQEFYGQYHIRIEGDRAWVVMPENKDREGLPFKAELLSKSDKMYHYRVYCPEDGFLEIDMKVFLSGDARVRPTVRQGWETDRYYARVEVPTVE